jgi:hypothetical protein
MVELLDMYLVVLKEVWWVAEKKKEEFSVWLQKEKNDETYYVKNVSFLDNVHIKKKT